MPTTSILLVEDNPLNRELVIECLEDLCLDIVVAEDGAQALERFRERRYAVILMDLQMPVMDGLETTRRIRHIEHSEGLGHTPVVGVTANAFPQDRLRCLDAGMDDYMSKPFDVDDFIARMAGYAQAASCS